VEELIERDTLGASMHAFTTNTYIHTYTHTYIHTYSEYAEGEHAFTTNTYIHTYIHTYIFRIC
jgi:hypothetical protein